MVLRASSFILRAAMHCSALGFRGLQLTLLHMSAVCPRDPAGAWARLIRHKLNLTSV